MVADPRRLYRIRLEAAREAAHQQVLGELGPPETPEERRRFDARVGALVDEWTGGWEGAGLGGGASPALPGWRRWWRRLRPGRGRRGAPG